MPVITAVLTRLGLAAWNWLSHASFWQVVSLVLGVLLAVQHFQLIDARHDAAKWKKQYDAVQTELTKLSASRNAQKATTVERIKVLHQKARIADDKAQVIEQAPLPGQCRTPKEVLDADI